MIGKVGRVRDEESRARVRAVLEQPGSSKLTHERVAELASVTKNMAKMVRREMGLKGGARARRRAPRPPRPKAPGPNAGVMTSQQADLLTRIYDVALGDGPMGGISTRRLMEIRGLLRTHVGQQLRETAEAARRTA